MAESQNSEVESGKIPKGLRTNSESDVFEIIKNLSKERANLKTLGLTPPKLERIESNIIKDATGGREDAPTVNSSPALKPYDKDSDAMKKISESFKPSNDKDDLLPPLQTPAKPTTNNQNHR